MTSEQERPAASQDSWQKAREQMVEEQIVARGITNPPILDAMRIVPRECFVAPQDRPHAYDDRPLPIGYGQTISQPFTVAFMADALQLNGNERILEIGTGCGYAAAVLSRLCREVHTVERIAELAEAARRRLAELGYTNVFVYPGDGSRGLPEHAPYDRIIAAAAAEQLPVALQEQLVDGGKIVLPVGSTHGVQTMKRYTRRGDVWHVEDLGKFTFVPLVGGEKSRRNFLIGSAALSAAAILARGAGQVFAQAPSGPTTAGTVARGSRAAVATVHPLATAAGIEALQRGGNAIDAAVAASLMLAVVDGFNSGLGGGGLALVRAGNAIHAIDGRETAPSGARPELYLRDGKPAPELSQTGPLAVAVPGLLALLEEMQSRWGRLDWKWALEHAAQVAAEGFELDAYYASRLGSAARSLRRFAASSSIFLDAQGRPWPVGHRLIQHDLASSLRQIASEGVDWFYRGPFAQRLETLMKETGGVMTAEDLANYRVKERSPIVGSYGHALVYGFPPPSSGGIHIAQMLGMLSHFDVRELYRRSEATWLHVLAECMKRAMADRAHWLGDADFVQVPLGLLDPSYLQTRASDIDLMRATPVKRHGSPPAADHLFFDRSSHTTHLTTADDAGNVVALTQTINTTFGSKMTVPGTGIVLNNEMDDFSLAPGVPNAFGLVGSQANAIVPGKRPLSSMSPTIVCHAQDQFHLTCGAAGGPRIITTVLQILTRMLDLDQTIGDAIAAPRIHHQWSPDELVCESSLPASLVKELEAMGHRVRTVKTAAVAQGIARQHSQFEAASDPRVPSASTCL
ncbi:MAG: hypothetical protein KatS3mg111_4347 [Pirellulaceae bacterium]|nr:MAG: hypothetical protein KatS3mg111_4347 [Pirellulaceae bacterium]